MTSTTWKRAAAQGCIALLLAALQACGGGGGGGGGGDAGTAGTGAGGSAATNLSITNIRAEGSQQEVFEGPDAIRQINITADLAGDVATLDGKTLYVLIEDPDDLFSATPTLTAGQGGIGNLMAIGGKPENRKVGDFVGPLRVHVCLDPACTRNLSGSPFEVPYRIKVLPGLKVSPADGPVQLTAAFGSVSAPWSATVQLPPGATGFSAVVEGSTPTDGPQFVGQIFDLQVTGNALSIVGQKSNVGRQIGTLVVSTTAVTSTGRTVDLRVTRNLTYDVSGPAGFAMLYGPDPLAFSMTAGSTGLAPAQTITALASAGGIYPEMTVEYLPAGPGGNLDANGFPWLAFLVSGHPAAMGFVSEATFSARACDPFAPQGAQLSCLAPGRYEARLWPATRVTQQRSAIPLLVTLTVVP